MSIQVNISYSWPDSWDLNHHIKKNYKSQFSTNLILKNKIEKRKPISKTEPKKKKLKEWGLNLT